MKKKKKSILAIVIVLIILVGCGVGAYFIFRNRADDTGGKGGALGISSRYDGMYYYYINGMYYKSAYIKLKGNQWASNDGDSGTYKVDGTNITLYKSVMGDDEIILVGIIEDGIISIKQDMGGISMNIYYCQEGKVPN